MRDRCSHFAPSLMTGEENSVVIRWWVALFNLPISEGPIRDRRGRFAPSQGQRVPAGRVRGCPQGG